ncbi:hypothetical protein [Nocardioides sp.]|uniref:hypothetical protein n=1 Tax=Nocardioides sp. TaxID=35761 RepID=UPI002C6100E6|nr:hypothetical protein [Nocardioides sp.]HXH79508.1 hypothetical protein [Nocardioides sp.]
MTPDLLFSALTAVVGAAFAFLLKERAEFKATIKELTTAANVDNQKKVALADRVPDLLAKIDDLERRMAT